MSANKKKLLINFFSEDLSEKEKKEFLDLASSDPDFVRSFIRTTEINSIIEESSKTKKSKNHLKNKMNKSSIYKISAFVTGIAAVFVLLFFLFNDDDKVLNSEMDLFSEYFQPMNVLITRGQLPANSPVSMLNAYQDGRYEDLHSILKENVDLTSDQDLACLILGISDIAMQDYDKAFSDLLAIPESSKNYSSACWYLALLEIKSENYNKAKEYLSYVKRENLIFMEKANKLLEALNEKSIDGSPQLK